MLIHNGEVEDVFGAQKRPGSNSDPATRQVVERILAQEEAHAEKLISQ
jgi:bacterioferritin (cytochrome b1)